MPHELSKTNKNMEKNVIKINEDTLRQIVAESVKRVLNEGFFGNKIVDSGMALKTLNQMAMKYGYQRVAYRKGILSLVTLDRDGEPTEIKTNIQLPKSVSSGMFGAGNTGWSEKDFEALKQQLQQYLEQRKQAHNEIEREKAQRDKEEREYNERKRFSPEAIQAGRERRWKRDAEIEAQWKKNRQGYYPTGEINDYRG